MKIGLTEIGLGAALLVGVTGCVGYVDGGGGGSVVVAGPDVGFYGGVYDLLLPNSIPRLSFGIACVCVRGKKRRK